MAVQAQYPSNVLLLNRNGQEGSFQPQAGGFLDQSHMIFNNGGNPRKRGREDAASNMNQIFSLQSQHPQLIDLAQLHNHQQQQANVVSTGLRLSFGEQQQQQQLQHSLLNHHLQQQHQQQQNQNLVSQSSTLKSLFSEDFAKQIKQQRDELDQFLHAQGEQLRRTLAEKRQRHYRALLGSAEESVSRRLREKQAEVEKATRRNAELEARASQLTMEAQVWQAQVRAQELTAASLQAQLQQAIMSGGVGVAQDRRVMDDGLGCTAGVKGQTEDAESAYIDPDRVMVSGPSCKGCRKRPAAVVLLPCRHLCLCTECDQVVPACPVCHSMRDSSVEVFLA